MPEDTLELLAWRRSVADLYARVRAATDPIEAHGMWRTGRDELFRGHPQSPLSADDPLRGRGIPYWPYDPSLRFEAEVQPAENDQVREYDSRTDGRIRMRLAGQIQLAELGIGLDVWWLAHYAGGLFLPVRDGTAGTESYGGGRYLLDSAKGADLGAVDGLLVVDLNFLYHPSCRYRDEWDCPLAPDGNTTRVPVRAGERMSHSS
jgi:hypothetical protein